VSVSSKTVIVRLTRTLDAKLTRVAKRRRMSRSEVIRAALMQLEEGEASPLDSIADLVGCVKGPRDLSTNPRHMEGFGRDHSGRRPYRRAS
jgi:hypothetical protein